MQVWILTFQRPVALNHIIQKIGRQGVKVNVWSNSPLVDIYPESQPYLGQLVINPVNTTYSTSWCARSWNSIYLKSLLEDDSVVALQDDVDVSEDFIAWVNEQRFRYDFIFGNAGDQFHYIHRNVVKRVGWWDERFNACYCGDADYLKRVYFEYDVSMISVEETHGWGFTHNPCGLSSHFAPRSGTPADPDYINQHTMLDNVSKNDVFERKDMHSTNPVIIAARSHYLMKWGEELSPVKSVGLIYERLLPEIDWYPWATRKL